MLIVRKTDGSRHPPDDVHQVKRRWILFWCTPQLGQGHPEDGPNSRHRRGCRQSSNSSVSLCLFSPNPLVSDRSWLWPTRHWWVLRPWCAPSQHGHEKPNWDPRWPLFEIAEPRERTTMSLFSDLEIVAARCRKHMGQSPSRARAQADMLGCLSDYCARSNGKSHGYERRNVASQRALCPRRHAAPHQKLTLTRAALPIQSELKQFNDCTSRLWCSSIWTSLGAPKQRSLDITNRSVPALSHSCDCSWDALQKLPWKVIREIEGQSGQDRGSQEAEDFEK